MSNAAGIFVTTASAMVISGAIVIFRNRVSIGWILIASAILPLSVGLFWPFFSRLRCSNPLLMVSPDEPAPFWLTAVVILLIVLFLGVAGFILRQYLITSPSSVPTEVLASSLVSGGSYRVLDFVQNGAIRNRTFENVTLYGPAVLAQGIGGVLIMTEDTFENSQDEVFLEVNVTTGKSGTAGMIPVINGNFRGCRLVGISIAGNAAMVAQWKKSAAR